MKVDGCEKETVGEEGGGSKEKIGGLSRRARVKTKKLGAHQEM